jgi:glyoxylate/hydroxypyruvate reductase A
MFDEAGAAMVAGEENVTNPADITHIACWNPPRDLERFSNLKVVISVGAGVDHMPALPGEVELSRTVAPGIDQMVRDWVVMAVLMLHRQMPLYIEQASRGEWTAQAARPAQDCRVGIMGLGRIGRTTGQSLAHLGFSVAGWSRSGRPVDGIEVFGEDRLSAFLARSDILVCLLPLTDGTRGILDDRLFAQLPHGAGLVHAGRGAQLGFVAQRPGEGFIL